MAIVDAKFNNEFSNFYNTESFSILYIRSIMNINEPGEEYHEIYYTLISAQQYYVHNYILTTG